MSGNKVRKIGFLSLFVSFILSLWILNGDSLFCTTKLEPIPLKKDISPPLQTELLNEESIFKDINTRKYRDLFALFEKRAKEFYNDPERKFDNGFFLQPIDELPFQAIDTTEYSNLPKDASFIVENFRGYNLAVSSKGKQIYVSENKDFTEFTPVKIGEEIPQIKHYYLEAIADSSLKLLMGHLKPNYYACFSFLEMYRITKNKKYLKPARRILLYIIDHVDEDGLYRLPFPGSPLAYRAMYQSYVLQILYEYSLLAPEKDEVIQSALFKLGKAFYFTDEGTRDHWMEAKIGEVIIDRLGIRPLNFKKLSEDLDVFYGYITRFNGNIPFCTQICDPPQFYPNYQNYNTMLLSVLSAKYLKRDIQLNNIFSQIFEVSKNGATWRLFRALYFAKFQFGFDDPDWVRMWEKQIMDSTSFYEIPTLCKYKILSEARD